MNTNSSFSISVPIIIGFIVLFLVCVYVARNIYERHDYVGEGSNKQLCKAWHIALPGYTTIYYPEQKEDLRKWVGTKYDGLIANNKADSSINQEATAGLALKAIGVFPDYELKEEGGHYILHRPEKTEKVFTWEAFYRIGPWKIADDL
jgi:hypothetical protein